MKKSRIHNLTFCYIVWNIGKFITMNHIKFVSLKYVIRFFFESLRGYVRLFKILECEAPRYMAEILPIRRKTLSNRMRGPPLHGWNYYIYPIERKAKGGLPSTGTIRHILLQSLANLMCFVWSLTRALSLLILIIKKMQWNDAHGAMLPSLFLYWLSLEI